MKTNWIRRILGCLFDDEEAHPDKVAPKVVTPDRPDHPYRVSVRPAVVEPEPEPVKPEPVKPAPAKLIFEPTPTKLDYLIRELRRLEPDVGICIKEDGVFYSTMYLAYKDQTSKVRVDEWKNDEGELVTRIFDAIKHMKDEASLRVKEEERRMEEEERLRNAPKFAGKLKTLRVR